MLQNTQDALSRRLSTHRAEGGTDLAEMVHRQRAESYTSVEVLEREKQRLFLGGPVPVALSARIPRAGDWFVHELLGHSVLVCRHTDGGIRAFINACRHRAMKVASGEGCAARGFTCPYHGWSYDLDGRLRQRPRESAFEGAPRLQHGLAPLPVREEAGVIFLGFSDAAWPAGPLLCGAEAELEPFGLAGYHPLETREHEARMNWKLGVDTFLEAYHLHKLHRATLKPLFFDDIALFDAFGHHSRMSAARRTFEEHTPGGNVLPHLTTVYQLFPNAVLVYQQDHVEFFEALPDASDPDRCRMRVTLYAPQPPETDSARRYWAANMELVFRVTTTEDFAACEQIQSNLRAGALDVLTFGRNEPGLIHFHQQLEQALA